MGDSQQDQSRQRAREAAEREMHGWLSSGQRECIVNAIATYVHLERDERMRGEPDPEAPWGTYPDDAKDTNYGRTCARCNAAIRAGGRYHHICATASVNAPSTDYDTGYAHGIRDTEEQRDALRARVAELEAERDEARHALDSIGDMLIPIEGAMTAAAARTITRCIEDAKWRKQPEFSERPASLRKRVAELEAVVRAADAMRRQSVGGVWQIGGANTTIAYDAARAKVEVPHG